VRLEARVEVAVRVETATEERDGQGVGPRKPRVEVARR
jgi:hypothetical protein